MGVLYHRRNLILIISLSLDILIFVTCQLCKCDSDGAVITSGNLTIGIAKTGRLIYNDVGLKYNGTYESLANGGFYEGWGTSATKAVSGLNFTGYSSFEFSDVSINFEAFLLNETEAISIVTVQGEGLKLLEVTHHYRPSPYTKSIYECTVTYKNVGNEELTDLRYRRSLDWDIQPNTLNECLDIVNITSTELEYALNCSLTGPDPRRPINFGFCGTNSIVCRRGSNSNPDSCRILGDGPGDKGANFIFYLRARDGTTPRMLQVNESTSFKIYFGAAEDTVKLRSAFALLPKNEMAEVYSLAYNPINVGAVWTCNNSTGFPAAFGFGYWSGFSLPTPSPTTSPTQNPTKSPVAPPTPCTSLTRKKFNRRKWMCRRLDGTTYESFRVRPLFLLYHLIKGATIGSCDVEKCKALCNHQDCYDDYVVESVSGNVACNDFLCRCLPTGTNECGTNTQCINDTCVPSN